MCTMKAKLFSLLMLLTLFSCKKNNSFIPQVQVQIVINTLDPQFQSLNGIGGWSYVEGGSRGIIVFRSESENFKAFDRHCSFEPENTCARVSVIESSLFAEDSCCNSRFQLIDGQAIGGPASVGLQEYRTSFDGNIIQIFN